MARESDEITRVASRASESARVQAESLRAKIAAETKRHRAALKDLIRGFATAESENARARETIEAARVATREKMCRRAAELKRRVAKKSAAAGAEVAKIRRESGIEGNHGCDDAPRQHPADAEVIRDAVDWKRRTTTSERMNEREREIGTRRKRRARAARENERL